MGQSVDGNGGEKIGGGVPRRFEIREESVPGGFPLQSATYALPQRVKNPGLLEGAAGAAAGAPGACGSAVPSSGAASGEGAGVAADASAGEAADGTPVAGALAAGLPLAGPFSAAT